MINLAGHPRAEEYIIKELTEAGIPIKWSHKEMGEPKSRAYGKMNTIWNGITFTREWYYWVAKGNIPLGIAEKMYEHPVMNNDVRANGDCTCPSPRDVAKEKFVTSSGVYSKFEDVWSEEEINKLRSVDIISHLADEKIQKEQDKKYPKFVDVYHIDSQEGLNLFVDYMYCTLVMKKKLIEASWGKGFVDLCDFYLEMEQ